MCFLPAALEITGYIIAAPHFLGLTMLESGIMGSDLAAVSPAVIVPRIIRLTEEGFGTKKQIPQIIPSGASINHVFVIVLFSTFIGIARGHGIDLQKIP